MPGRGFALVVMLGDGSDSVGDFVVVGSGVALGPEPRGWVEQCAAQVLQRAGALAGHGEAAPSSTCAVQNGPDQRQAADLAGEPADDLDAAAGLPEGALDEGGMPDQLVVLGREPQVGGQSVPARRWEREIPSGRLPAYQAHPRPEQRP